MCHWLLQTPAKAGPLPCVTTSMLSSSPAQIGSSIIQLPLLGSLSFSSALHHLEGDTTGVDRKAKRIEVASLWLYQPSLHPDLLARVNYFIHHRNFPIPNCQILPPGWAIRALWALFAMEGRTRGCSFVFLAASPSEPLPYPVELKTQPSASELTGSKQANTWSSPTLAHSQVGEWAFSDAHGFAQWCLCFPECEKLPQCAHSENARMCACRYPQCECLWYECSYLGTFDVIMKAHVFAHHVIAHRHVHVPIVNLHVFTSKSHVFADSMSPHLHVCSWWVNVCKCMCIFVRFACISVCLFPKVSGSGVEWTKSTGSLIKISKEILKQSWESIIQAPSVGEQSESWLLGPKVHLFVWTKFMLWQAVCS